MERRPVSRQPREIADYDFRQAQFLSADQLRELQEHCANLCRALQRYVPESTGLAAGFSLEKLLPITYDGYLDGLPESPVMAICQLGRDEAPMVWQIDAAPIYAYMDAILGGDGNVAIQNPDRDLTMLERALVSQIVMEFLDTWTDVWQGLAGVDPTVIEVRQTTGRFGSTSLQEAIIVASISFTIAGVGGHMRIAMPSVALRALLKQSNVKRAQADPDDPATRAAAAELRGAPVKVSVQLAGTQMTLRELQALQVGDVLVLDRGPREQLDILVSGIPKFRAISGLVNKHVAVRVTGRAA